MTTFCFTTDPLVNRIPPAAVYCGRGLLRNVKGAPKVLSVMLRVLAPFIAAFSFSPDLIRDPITVDYRPLK